MEVLAACHVHSHWSYDGSWSLEELGTKFSRHGYRIIMMTEHDRGFTASRHGRYREACARASSVKVLVLPGMEYSDANNRVHVLVWGPVPFLGEGLPINDVLEAVTRANGVAVLAHPSRKSAWRSFESQWAERLLGIEVWNRKCDGWAPSRTALPLVEMAGAVPFVGLDFHNQRQSFPLAMALDIDAQVTEEEVLHSLRARRCSARAFGLPLDQNLLRGALPALRIAEQSRRAAASIARYSKVLTS
jgi:hypothetical protein